MSIKDVIPMNKEKGIICYTSPRGYGKTYYELEKLRQENQQLKEMIDEEDGCNHRRRQIFELKDKLCVALKDIKNLKQENQQLQNKIDKTNLTNDDIRMLLYCIDLVIQNFGDNNKLETLYHKLVSMKY